MKNKQISKITFISAALLLSLVCFSFAKEDHRQYNFMKLADCQSCHRASGVMANHGAFWMKEHRLLAQKAANNCADCHQQSFCLDCHQGGGIEPDLRKSLSSRGEYMPRSHRSDFISIHSIKAADNPQNCYRCHESSFCQSCHTKIGNPGGMKIKSHLMAGNTQNYALTSEHAAEARRNLQSCESCHPDATVCVSCHTSGKTNPHPGNWRDIQSKYRDVRNGRNCKVCHLIIPN